MELSFSVDDQVSAFIKAQVHQGNYPSESEVVKAALRLLEEREKHVHAVREALIEGENSGLATPLDFDAFLSDMRREYSAKE